MQYYSHQLTLWEENILTSYLDVLKDARSRRIWLEITENIIPSVDRIGEVVLKYNLCKGKIVGMDV